MWETPDFFTNRVDRWRVRVPERPVIPSRSVNAISEPIIQAKTLFQATLDVHAFIYQHTNGRIGHRLLGVPCLMLRTTGRRTGQTRTNSLVYAQDGGRWLVVASKGGNPKAPAWLHNLRANPQGEVQIGRTRHQVTATEIGHDDPEFARLWKLVNDNNGGRYDAYQRRTARPIPVVVLTPEA